MDKSSVRNILVPVDFSEQSLLALEQSYSMSRMANAEITLLHIIVDTNPFWGIFTPDEKEDAAEKFKKKLDDFADLVSKKTGIIVNTIVEKGKLIDKIIEITHRLNSKYLIVGTIVRDNLKEKIIGSNATRLVKESSCPVITIKGKRTTGTCQKIILPIDLSVETDKKVEQAITLARYFKSTIYAVTVSPSKDDSLIQRFEDQLVRIQDRVLANNVKCFTNLIKPGKNSDDISKQILSYAYSINADLIVIMAKEEDESPENYLGPIANRVINQSEIPVMSISSDD